MAIEGNYHFLTVRLPWPYLIFVEKDSPVRPKRIETRTWQPQNHGLTPPFKLGIHAGKTIDRAGVEYLKGLTDVDIKMSAADAGLVFGMVIISKVEQYTRETWQAYQPESYELGELPTDQPYYAWFMEEPRRLEQELRINGRLGIFSVPKSLFLYLTSHETK